MHASGLIKIYKKRPVVDNVKVEVSRGEVVGLLGPNGAGKTTTFYMIVGLIRPNAGNIYLNGENITGLPMYKRARMGLGYLPQEPSVFRKLTVEENLLGILETLKLSKAERKERLEVLLEELDLHKLRKSKAYSLSGGERRRLEITRSLITEPKFILLDEPFAGIDPIAVYDCQEVIKELKDKNLGVLLTDHNVRETLTITDRSYIMCDGKILISGTKDELITNPKAREIYLGDKFTM